MTEIHCDRPCPVCGSLTGKPLRQFTRQVRLAFPGPVVQCPGCGLGRLATLPSSAELLRYYAGPSYLAGFQTAGIDMVTQARQSQGALIARLESLEQQSGRPGRLLDVGASSGAFLALAQARGWDIAGVELGDEGVRQARMQHGIELFHGPLEQAPFADESFDVVHASHVLEHLPDPAGFLGSCRKLLKTQGILVIEVPSELGDLFSRVRATLLRRLPESVSVPSPHLYFFTPASLKRLFVQNGFAVKMLSTPRRDQSDSSRFPGGAWIKRGLYQIEETLRQGPLIEIHGQKL